MSNNNTGRAPKPLRDRSGIPAWLRDFFTRHPHIHNLYSAAMSLYFLAVLTLRYRASLGTTLEALRTTYSGPGLVIRTPLVIVIWATARALGWLRNRVRRVRRILHATRVVGGLMVVGGIATLKLGARVLWLRFTRWAKEGAGVVWACARATAMIARNYWRAVKQHAANTAHEAYVFGKWLALVWSAARLWLPKGELWAVVAVARLYGFWRTPEQIAATHRALGVVRGGADPREVEAATAEAWATMTPREMQMMRRGVEATAHTPRHVWALLWLYSAPFELILHVGNWLHEKATFKLMAKFMARLLAITALPYIVGDWLLNLHATPRQHVDRAWALLQKQGDDAIWEIEPYNPATDAPTVRRAALAVAVVPVVLLVGVVGALVAPWAIGHAAQWAEAARACLNGALK